MYQLSFIFFLLSGACSLTLIVAAGPRQCRGENNQPVDWYVLYKLPKRPESSNKLVQKGVAYLYMTSETSSQKWTLSDKDISSKNSIPGNTLASLYDNKQEDDELWLLYNDQPPNRSTGRYGHAKGVVNVDDNKGYWLIHSVPNFPPAPNGGKEPRKRASTENITTTIQIPDGSYDYPSTGKQNGQSFLCISLDLNQFDLVGKQLMYNQITVYKNNVPKELGKKFSVLAQAANQVRIKTAPFYNAAILSSLEQTRFISFAKSAKWNKDLYDDFVAPELKTDLLTETWLNGRGRLPSECNGSRVFNVESVYLKEVDLNFNSSHDHSKWAVASENKSNSNWVCVGDINRADTQFTRGGGTVCLNLAKVWKNYRDSVAGIEPCPKPKKTFFQKLKNWFS
ncbi:plancitoxin-1 [Leptopilina heterotoma]|uniref:plancitoxin-1 n=1 Tax=Leptopilina heterotoma TaxID=63436 RepID=UPI001CA83C04|nr:plancitoxin-1 [Leptopilina heterotoma]XP_043467776.1 plancitoxin-1 [Leptopilina heterotoma]XP_043467777.1 plancitoxin-1 [Leptopilina heterotoma]XP_043467778.1 plancitoxin-1 [Leptopilina heterotoma]XP_043467779.1 plancitoxin-1 [Leptopilina heterotoma]